MLLTIKNTLLKRFSLYAFIAVLTFPLAALAQTITSIFPATGPAGTMVFITRNNLTEAKSVLLNGKPMPMIFNTSNLMLVTVPVGGSTGKLVLNTAAGAVMSTAQFAVTTAAPLPVVLTAFNGQVTSTGNQLSWVTASEQNSRSFEVERLADGGSFVLLGSVAAAGTSPSAHTYQYLDAAAPTGLSYYRLRQVDLDGTVTYSPVVSLSATRLAVAAQPQAYPSPFAEALSISLPGTEASQSATIALFTLDGHQVYRWSLLLSATPQALDGLPTLPAGLYLLRTTTAAGTTTQRLSHN
jgi:hypothetical protein